MEELSKKEQAIIFFQRYKEEYQNDIDWVEGHYHIGPREEARISDRKLCMEFFDMAISALKKED